MSAPDTVPSTGILLRAAGCTPQSSSCGGNSWSETFLSPSMESVTLHGKGDGIDGDSLWARKETVRKWIAAHGIKLTPEAIRETETAYAIQRLSWATERNAHGLESIREALTALRLSSADQTCIKVWPFHAAPPELRSLSPHGGDEDWLALVPPGMDIPPWMEGTSFGCCDVSEHPINDGWTVCIGAHA